MGISSVLAVPLKLKDATIGLLEVFSRSPYAFGSPEEATLRHAAEQVLRVLSANLSSTAKQDDWQSVLELSFEPEPVEAVVEPTATTELDVPTTIVDVGEPAAIERAPKLAESQPPAPESAPRRLESEPPESVPQPLVSDAVLSLMPVAEVKPDASRAAGAPDSKPKPKRRFWLFLITIAVLAGGAIGVSFRGFGVLPKAPSPPATSPAVTKTPSPLELLRHSAELGEPSAQLALATRYHNGDGVERNEAESVHWLQEAARQGNGDAQFQLGNAYADGRGVGRDPISAYACYVLAGANGNSASEEALRFLTPKLTDTQIAQVRSTVGEMYMQGRGTPVDYVAAYTWFKLAESAGSADGQRARQTLASKMSRQQIDAANRRASEWLKRHGQQPR